ncbi:MAG: chemotaxis protein CheA [Gammaproteobacteria bacterium]|nr:chemotaxis protein CheA [Gammaproteobacteria bacterium]
MAINTDDDILQDFLVEAGEIVEALSEQLVELERRSDDVDLLNAVFRGFHTVKGGAGFLGLTPLVEVCHRAEDVFNVLRQGKRKVDASLMDTVLTALDIVKDMMGHVRAGEEPPHADPALLEKLGAFALPQNEDVDSEAARQVPEEVVCEAPAIAAEKEDDSSALPGQEAGSSSDGDITDDEFEALLDQLHGKGTHAGVPAGNTVSGQAPDKANASSDTITDEEFEALIDQLQGKPSSQKVSPQSDRVAETKNDKADQVEAPVHRADPVSSGRETPQSQAKDATQSQPKDTVQAQSDTTVRVDTKRLDDIMNLVGELVLVRNRLATLKSAIADEEISQAVGNLDLVTSDLQNAVMKTRMQPIKKVFSRFPRVVRDLARSLNKEVNLELHGEETDLDKNLVEALADPLVHLVRNSVDHGIEIPDKRAVAGKPRAGTVILSARQEGDHILLSIQDDGAGMDPDVLRRKAVEKGILDEEAAARLDDRACYNLIFMPGFSTKTQISDISGRGVGMDVVKTRIAQLNGAVEIESQLGKGSLFTIKVPLTLAIMPTLMVKLGKQIFAMPLVNVNEIFDMSEARTNTVDGQLVVTVRNKALPMFYLKEWLACGEDLYNGNTGGYVVVVNVGTQRIACVVEQLIGQEEVVIKPLGALLHGTKGLAGATITGNGRIALILDFPGLMEAHAY